MIVFWRHHRRRDWSHFLWTCYKGRAKLRNSQLHIYPCNGKRQTLSDFIAFDDANSTPPRLLASHSNSNSVTQNVETLTRAKLFSGGSAADHLPPTYIDRYGNVRCTDDTLSLVLAGPGWDATQEDEFQQARDLPF